MFEAIVYSLSAALFLQLAVAHHRRVRALTRRDRRRPARPTAYPSVSVIRPVKGRDMGQEENFRAALDTGYPGDVETIFVFEGSDDPGYGVAEACIAAHERAGGPGTARIVTAGPPPPGRTGKISNMIAGVAEATGELIAFGDSDTRPDREVLGNLVEHLAQDERAGAVFAPAVLTSPPRTAGDVGNAVILNAFLLAEAEYRAGPGRELPFLIGNLMVFRRRALDAIGGIECAEGQLVDDMYLGAQVVKAGFHNVMGTASLSIIGHGLGLGEFVRQWRRWLFFGRAGMTSSFVWPFIVRAVGYFLVLGLAIASLATGRPLLAVAPALVWLCEGFHQLRLNRIVGAARVPATHSWMAWAAYPLALPILVSMIVYPKLRWRGHVYRVGFDATLEDS